MAAPVTDAGEFESWLNDRLDSLEVDREVYGAYILGVLQEEESDEEKEDALQGILSAFLVNMPSGGSASSHRGFLYLCVLLSVSSAGRSARVSCRLWNKNIESRRDSVSLGGDTTGGDFNGALQQCEIQLSNPSFHTKHGSSRCFLEKKFYFYTHVFAVYVCVRACTCGLLRLHVMHWFFFLFCISSIVGAMWQPY